MVVGELIIGDNSSRSVDVMIDRQLMQPMQLLQPISRRSNSIDRFASIKPLQRAVTGLLVFKRANKDLIGRPLRNLASPAREHGVPITSFTLNWLARPPSATNVDPHHWLILITP